MQSTSTKSPSRLIYIAAFISVYVIWGSTYLGIRYAIETIPPWTMAAARVLVAGVFMLILAFFAKEPRLSRLEIRYSILTGTFLMLANATVCYAEKWVPSGIAAVMIGAMPIWILVIGRFFFHESQPTVRKVAGSVIGLAGVAVIAADSSSQTLQTEGFERYAILILLISSWMWATGTHLQRGIAKTASPFRYTGWQMLSGGVLVAFVAVLFGEPFSFHLSDISAVSFQAWLYLVFFGSVIAFTAYSWLGRHVEPHALSTYALVNPVIAVGLGWAIAGEVVTTQFFIATCLVIVGLWLLLFKAKVR